MKKAFITGITGQDGSLLAELLLSKGYHVHGLIRECSFVKQNPNENLHGLLDRLNQSFFLHSGDINNKDILQNILLKVLPDEIYLLAGQSNVYKSFEEPELTFRDNSLSIIVFLEILRTIKKDIRVFFASSSEVFGGSTIKPQDENTPMNALNPYGLSKIFSMNLIKIYRENFGLHIVNGILYNHESPRRTADFVTKKVCQSVAQIKARKKHALKMGKLDIYRDWGDARDFVKGMWLSLQKDYSDDYIFATGKLHSLENLLQTAFACADLNWRDYYQYDKSFDKPMEKILLCGNPQKAINNLGWRIENSFEKLIKDMVSYEMSIEKLKNF